MEIGEATIRVHPDMRTFQQEIEQEVRRAEEHIASLRKTLADEAVREAVTQTTAELGEMDLELAQPEPAVERERGTGNWEGVLGVEGMPTADRRLLIAGEIAHRDLPLPFMVQTVTAERHEGSEVAGRIEGIEHVPVADFERREEFGLKDVPEGAVVIWGYGILDGSEAAQEADRLIENGAGVSLDIPHDRLALFDPETLEEVKEEPDLAAILEDRYLTGIAGKIAGATVVTIPAFEQASIQLVGGVAVVASAFGIAVASSDDPGSIGREQRERFQALTLQILTAAATPLKPPKSWFQNPKLTQLTPLTITNDGKVYGHLADWSGCHTGFTKVCVPPFRSSSGYAYFNVGEIETEDGELVPCGKLMFCMEGNGHAPVNPRLSWQEVARYYDDATKVGGFVRAGADRFGTWLAGCLRPGLSDEEIQHLRTHPPSGDWRPIPGKGTELVASFSVPIPGFPIPRTLVASGVDGELVLISGPLVVEPLGARAIQRRRKMLQSRAHALVGGRNGDEG